jgi:hypothetical protein
VPPFFSSSAAIESARAALLFFRYSSKLSIFSQLSKSISVPSSLRSAGWSRSSPPPPRRVALTSFKTRSSLSIGLAYICFLLFLFVKDGIRSTSVFLLVHLFALLVESLFFRLISCVSDDVCRYFPDCFFHPFLFNIQT